MTGLSFYNVVDALYSFDINASTSTPNGISPALTAAYILVTNFAYYVYGNVWGGLVAISLK